MSDPFFLVAGDLLPIIEGVLEDEHGDPIPLPAASSVTFSVQPSGFPSSMFSASVAFSTASAGAASVGHVSHAWATGFVPTRAGFYQGQWRIHYANGKPMTVPNPGYVPITVGTSLGG